MKLLENKRRLTIVLAIVLVAAVAVALAVCSRVSCQPESDIRVAAQVGNTTITEGEVSQCIATYRAGTGLEDNEAWHRWLDNQNLAPADFRTERLSQMIHAEVVRQAAAREGIEAPEDELRNDLSATREEFDSQAGHQEGDWLRGIGENGYDEETLAQSIITSYLESKLIVDLAQFEQDLGVTINPMPANVPYA